MNDFIHNSLFDYTIVNHINVGIFSVDKHLNITLWNKFMETHSSKSTHEVLGRNIFECFPELPRKWFERKIKSIFLLKNYAFTSWQQRPYLFRFPHHRPITGGIDYMHQDCTFLPIKNLSGEVSSVCVTIVDVTETSIYQKMLQDTLVKLEELSQKDGLTGLLNRRYFTQQFEIELKRSIRYDKQLSFLLFDLDHFKKVNDIYGHQAGDHTLRIIAQVTQDSMRDTDIVARYGGEEFAVIFPEEGELGAYEAAERLRKIIESKPVDFQNQKIPISISVGVSSLTSKNQTIDDLIREADEALYKSKQNGRNQVTRFHAGEPCSIVKTNSFKNL